MADVVEDALKELHAQIDADKLAEPTPEPATPDPVPATATRPRHKLDEVILDDDRLPESLRGKTAFDIDEKRRRAIEERDNIAFERNRLRAERDALQQAYERELERRAPVAPVAPQPTAIDKFRARVSDDPNALYNNPNATLTAAIEAGAEEAEARLRPQLEAVEERAGKLEQKAQQDAEDRRNQTIYNVYQSVRPAEIPVAFWNGKFNAYAASFAIHGKLPLDDPNTYLAALDNYRQTFAEFNPNATATQTPATPAPIAPAPPVGGGRPSTPPASKPTAHLNNHDRAAMAKITAIFKEKTGMSATADDIMGDLKSDPKTRSAFP